MYSLGRGANGRLGHGDEKDVWSPRRVVGKLRELFVSSLTCGGSHTLCGTGVLDVPACDRMFYFVAYSTYSNTCLRRRIIILLW